MKITVTDIDALDHEFNVKSLVFSGDSTFISNRNVSNMREVAILRVLLFQDMQLQINRYTLYLVVMLATVISVRVYTVLGPNSS